MELKNKRSPSLSRKTYPSLLYPRAHPSITPKPTTSPPNTPSKNPTPQNKPPLGTNSNRRCHKCQGLGDIASVYPNQRVITLAEYEATQVEEEEEEKELCLMEGMEGVIEDADEGDLLVLRRTLSGLKGSQDEQTKNIFH